MKEKTVKPNIKEEARLLRKKVKRVEENRSSIKTKNSEKGKVSKTQQDRKTELKKNRDEWNTKYKEQKQIAGDEYNLYDCNRDRRDLNQYDYPRSSDYYYPQ